MSSNTVVVGKWADLHNSSFAGLPKEFMLPQVLIYHIAYFSKVNQLKAGYLILLEGTQSGVARS